MSADLVPFQSDEFELSVTLNDADGFRVVASGLARALGMRDAFRLMESIPDAEKGYTTASTPGGEQRVGYVTEAGFYRALGQRQAARIPDDSVRAQVERFQSWVYGTVLPAIRRGESAVERMPSHSEALRGWAREIDAREAAEERVRELKPKAEYVDNFVSRDDLTKFRDAANQLGSKEHELRELLVERRWIYRKLIGRRWSGSQGRLVDEVEWRAYAEHADHFRLMGQHNAPRHHNNQLRQTLYITPDGLTALRRLVAGAVEVNA